MIDLCIVMDESGSIYDKNPPDAPGNYNWDLMKQFVTVIISSLNVSPEFARISLLKYSHDTRVQFDLDDITDEDEMVQTVLEFPHLSGGTNTSGALRMMRESIFRPERGDREGVPNIGIIITDGESTIDENLTAVEAALVKQV